MTKATYQLSVFFLSLCLCVSAMAAAADTGKTPAVLLAAKSSSEEQTLITQLRSSAPTEKRHAAIAIHRFYLHNKRLVAVVEDELLKGYRIWTRDKRYVDAMAWMCNVLGDSGNQKYAPTLRKVSYSAKNRKVRSYAKRNYRKIR
ncbi:MAG: hypothetical protein PVJ19_23315 [Desulfobacteraceae bacterium]|jgi:hypothetical protein